MKHDEKLIRDISERTTARTSAPGVKHPPLAIDRLLTDASDLLRAGATAEAVEDGYPKSTPGAVHGPGSVPPNDDASELDPRLPDAQFRSGVGTFGHTRTSKTTSTEAAVIAREHGTQPDPVGRLAARQQRQLTLLVKLLDKIAATNAAHQRMKNPQSDTTKPYCHVAKMHGLPWDEKWEAVYTTTFETVKGFDTLDEPVRVCQSVYDWVRTNKRYPTREEMLAMLQRSTARAMARVST